jgi:RimJ/RimL family protein N-acetyltransferase
LSLGRVNLPSLQPPHAIHPRTIHWPGKGAFPRITPDGTIGGVHTYTIRPARPGDATRLLDLQRALDRESRFMLLEPEERTTDPVRLRDRLSEEADPSYTIVADDGGLAGYIEVTVLPFARARRTGYVVMGVRAARAGQGVGTALLQAAAEQARRQGMRRLELTVMTHNRRALGLYLTCGFEVEGLRRSALVLDGTNTDEYYMGLIL